MQNQNRGDLSRQQLMRGVGALGGRRVFYLGEDFYETDRCIFQVSEHYENMLR
jgi:hypothetical protein